VNDLDRLIGELERQGLLLLIDARLPNVAAIVAGENVRGSWWAHARSHEIFHAATALGEHTDVVVAKLVSGKVTFVHRRLWPALLAVATSGEPWQLAGLPAAERALLEEVRESGEVRAEGAAARSLEAKLLVHADEIHTEKGSHAKILETWDRWAKRAGARRGRMGAGRGREELERTVGALNTATKGTGRLPWLATALAFLAALLAPARAAEHLRSETIRAQADGEELEVRLGARAPGTAWGRAGRECAVLRVAVDGRYDQHVFLLGAEEEWSYRFLVGPLARGAHTLDFEWENQWLRGAVERPHLGAVETVAVEQEPVLRAPILHLRHDTIGRFSDVPLVLYWDREPPDRTVYTFVFSNEDGGTNTERLLARWGRTTDIEWCYAYAHRRGGLEDEYQARDHKTLAFRGHKEGQHPVLHDATLNNVFADTADDPAPVRVRPVPIFGDLQGRAREVVMDRLPWTYSIMADEMIRENKIGPPPHETGEIVSDLRNYAYVEVCADQHGTELFFELQVRARPEWYASDRGDARSRIVRSGCARAAVELPAGTRPGDLGALRIQCRPAPTSEGERPVSSPAALIRRVPALFLLDERYRPAGNILDRTVGRRLRPGESVTLSLP